MKNLKKITLCLLFSIAAHESIAAKTTASTSQPRVHMPLSLQAKLKEQAELLDQLRGLSTSNLHKRNIALSLKLAQTDLEPLKKEEKEFRSPQYWNRQLSTADATIKRLKKHLIIASSEANPNMTKIGKDLKEEYLAKQLPSDLRNQTLDS